MTTASVLPTADEYFLACLNRTIPLLGESALHRLRGCTVGIAGCGGVGAAVALTLARTGVGGFVLADPGSFDLPDINRQWGANVTSLGRNKAEVYAEMLRSINPHVRVRILSGQAITEESLECFFENVNLVMDSLDIAVPTELRMRMFRLARTKGLYSISAPIIGFGAVVAVAAPDGMPMEAVLGAYIEEAAVKARLPEGLRPFFVPEHLGAMEEMMVRHKVPSIAISPVLATSLVCTEALLILLGPTIAGWRPPISLPQTLIAEPLTQQFRVTDVRELAKPKPPRPGAEGQPEATPSVSLSADSPEERRRLLSQVGFNVALLPHHGIAVDLLTDSWSDLPWVEEAEEAASPDASSGGRVETVLQGFYGYKFAVPVFRGRFAEALLAKAAVQQGWTIAANTLFPSTRFHLEASGARLVDLSAADVSSENEEGLFKGNLDLERLAAMVAAQEIQAVYLELAVNAIGGHPVSMANLKRIRTLTETAGVPVFLDATRAFENAVLIQERESGFSSKCLTEIVRELCGLSDACATSLTKDFKSPVGGFVGTNREGLFWKVRELAVLAYGTGLDERNRNRLARALRPPGQTDGPAARVRMVKRLWDRLRPLGVPVLEPVGGHAVFVNASAFLPHLPAAAYPTHALAGALFVEGGVRTIPNMIAPEQKKQGVQMLRLAVPINRYEEKDMDSVGDAFERIMKQRQKIGGLKRVGGPPGLLGDHAAQFQPLPP